MELNNQEESLGNKFLSFSYLSDTIYTFSLLIFLVPYLSDIHLPTGSVLGEGGGSKSEKQCFCSNKNLLV